MFSSTTEYALRALTLLAAQRAGIAILGKDLSRQTAIPGSYLTKIMLALRNAGLVGAARGNAGGYWLAREADSIRLLEVVRLFQGVTPLRRCLLSPSQECSDVNPCSAHGAWKGLRAEYINFLERVTLADISNRPPSAPAPEVPDRAM